ncbi:MAG TPA: GNAT family N-acetyltransferase [Candidatus Baltobacteraceae bacterium]|nr:GNAT family N-acetyltransferase [Candidatus Baltobacteraceae bacterium]
MRTITTKRLRLIPVTPANAGVLWEVLQEPDLRDYQDLPDLGLEQFLGSVASRPIRLEPGVTGRFEWLVYVGNGNEAVGWVSLRITERTRSTGEVGYSVVRAYRGRGIASESVAALVEEAFTTAQLRRVRAYCVPENVSSRAVLRRNRFEDDGMLPHGATVQGQPVDVIAYTLERDRWSAALKSARSATGS